MHLSAEAPSLQNQGSRNAMGKCTVQRLGFRGRGGDGAGLCWDGQGGLRGLSRIHVQTGRAGRTSVGMPGVSRHLEVDK